MSNVVISKSDFTVTVKKQGGRIISTAPITVKNQIQEINGIDDFDNVDKSQKEDGATFIYNANTGKYEVKLYNSDPLLSIGNLYVTSLWANNSTGTNNQVLFTNGTTNYWGNSVNKILASTGLSGGGQGDVTLSVNATYIATITSNNALFAYGKREEDLSVNFAEYSSNANFAYVANVANLASLSNNSTFAYGKREEDLSVNFAEYSSNANFAYVANNSNLLDGLDSTYFTNATNIQTGTLQSARLPNTSVVVGQYGNSSQIPVITVDQHGRINSISISAVGGVTDYQYNSGNNTFTLATADGSVFNATINTVNDFNITGNLIVSGTTTTVNTQTLTVKDSVIRLNDGQLTPFNDIGILMQRYSAANSTNYNVAIAWDEDATELKIGKTAEDGANNEILFSENWVRFDQAGNAYILQTIEAGNNVKASNSMIINNVSFTETNYPGEANTATYFNGIIDCGTY